MIQEVTPETFESILARQDGYLVNKYMQGWVIIHNLRYLHGNCRATMRGVVQHPKERPKLFATTLEEAYEAARRLSGPWSSGRLCGNCERNKEAATMRKKNPDSQREDTTGNEPVSTSSQVVAQWAPAGSFVVAFDAESWMHLLEVLGWARETASREGTKEIEYAASELLTALSQAEPEDHPLQGPRQDWANEE